MRRCWIPAKLGFEHRNKQTTVRDIAQRRDAFKGVLSARYLETEKRRLLLISRQDDWPGPKIQ
jgi:hypothetical protein